MRMTGLIRGAALAASLAGCYGTVEGSAYPATTAPPASRATVAVLVPPPTPIVEAPPPRPYVGAAWQAGSWEWRSDLGRYSWVPGRWVTAPRSGVVYVPPRWERTDHGYMRVPGRWQNGTAQDRYGRTVWYDSLGRPHYM